MGGVHDKLLSLTSLNETQSDTHTEMLYATPLTSAHTLCELWMHFLNMYSIDSESDKSGSAAHSPDPSP